MGKKYKWADVEAEELYKFFGFQLPGWRGTCSGLCFAESGEWVLSMREWWPPRQRLAWPSSWRTNPGVHGSSYGYTINLDIHVGKTQPHTEHGLSYDAVMHLVQLSYLSIGYHVYFCTSLQLFLDLARMKFGVSGGWSRGGSRRKMWGSEEHLLPQPYHLLQQEVGYRCLYIPYFDYTSYVFCIWTSRNKKALV